METAVRFLPITGPVSQAVTGALLLLIWILWSAVLMLHAFVQRHALAECLSDVADGRVLKQTGEDHDETGHEEDID